MKSRTSFPAQKLPMSKKNQAWKEACVDYIVGAGSSFGNNGRSRAEEMQTYYDLYNSIYNEKDLKYVTNPFKQEDGFPAVAQDYNIIKPYIDQLLGEETKRPFNFNVCRTSDIASSEMQDKAKEMLMNYIQASIFGKLGPEEQAQYQQALESGEVQTPEQIAKWMQHEYKDVAETQAVHALRFLKTKLNLSHTFYKGWKDALIAGEEIYYVGVQNGDPVVERVNPEFFDYERSLDLEFIHEAGWCRRKMIMSATDIYDRFYDKMDEKQLNELLELIDEKPGSGMNPEIRKTNMDYNAVKMHRMNSLTDNPFDTDHITVYHCCWKSFKKIGFVTIVNPETEEPEEYQVDETYKVIGTELNIEWQWIVEVWEGYRIGDDMYLGIQPIEYQHISADNPNSQKLPYTGIVYNNTNSTPRSLVSMMKPLQYMYIVLWYRLELALSRDKGKVAVMDITQIPKSMNIDVNKWMHYLSALGVAFVNPYDEGWCFDPDTLVATPYGAMKMKDIRLGQQVYTPGMQVANVTKLFHGEDEMYTIVPTIGLEPQKVTADHLVRYRYRINGHSDSEIRLDKAKDLMLKFKQNKYYAQRCFIEREPDYFVNNTKSTSCGRDMYLLGLWLGDGSKGTPEIESMDPEIIQYLEDYASTHGLRCSYRHNNESRSMTIRLSSAMNKKRGQAFKNQFIEDLRFFGVYDNKDVSRLKIESREDALNLLAGLIDTDGSVYRSKNGKGNYIEFTQCESHKNIVDLFVELSRKLGFKVSVKKHRKAPKKIHKNKSITYPQTAYRVRIFDGTYDIPTKIHRKKINFQKKRSFNKYYSHFTIEYSGRGEYYGFAIDNSSHEFLLADMAIVHNCIPGREGGKPSQFNQLTSWDLSMSNVIAEYINLMQKVEDMVAKLTGITPQRQGQIAASELVSNANTAVNMSYCITEPWFWQHNQVKREVLTMLLNTSKSAWKDGKRMYLNYILDDATRAFIQLSDEFFYEDMDVFIDDSTKNQQILDQLKQLTQPAMQNGASLLDITEIITMDNINMIKNKLQEIEQKRMEQAQQQQQQEAEQQQQLIQMQNEVKEEELMLKEAELDLEKYKIDQDNATKIAVAQLNAYRGVQDMDQDKNGVPDVMEIGKQALEQQKINSDQATKQLELNNKRREADQKKEIENKKIQLEKDRMKHETEMQRMADKAAMEREQLKARTALKNKVAGER